MKLVMLELVEVSYVSQLFFVTVQRNLFGFHLKSFRVLRPVAKEEDTASNEIFVSSPARRL